jgi:hypothetical protein
MCNRNLPVNKRHRILKEFSLHHRLGCCCFSVVSLSELAARKLAKLLQCSVPTLPGKGLKDIFFISDVSLGNICMSYRLKGPAVNTMNQFLSYTF